MFENGHQNLNNESLIGLDNRKKKKKLTVEAELKKKKNISDEYDWNVRKSIVKTWSEDGVKYGTEWIVAIK